MVELAVEAWRQMFQIDDGGVMRQNKGVIRAFSDIGIMPFNPHALPDSAFKAAEMAGMAGMAIHDAHERLGIVELTPEQRKAEVDKALPFVPAIPVDMEKARAIARKSRATVPQLLTSIEVRTKAAQRILADEAKKEQTKQKRAASAAKKAAKAEQAATKATAVASGCCSGAPAAPRRGRPRKVSGSTLAEPASTIAAPLAGQKRPAEPVAIGGDTTHAARPLMLRIVRKQPMVNMVE